MKFTLHHTCSQEGGQDHVLREFPFESLVDPKKKTQPYLGRGYYFWDYNEAYSKIWGAINYDSRFYVCETEVFIDSEREMFFLDLVGNRKDLCFFVELLLEFELIDKNGTKGIDLSRIIEYLRKNCPKAFPFEVIRAVDYMNDKKKGIEIAFTEKRESYTVLNPRIIFSFKSKESITHIKKPFIKFAS